MRYGGSPQPAGPGDAYVDPGREHWRKVVVSFGLPSGTDSIGIIRPMAACRFSSTPLLICPACL